MGDPSDFRVGFGRVCITPPVGTWLCGFAAREHPAAGVHDDLYARAMVFECAGRRVAVVTTDLIGVDSGTVSVVRQRAVDELGLLSGGLLLHGTHTHSGPVLMLTESMGPADELYRSNLKRLLFTAVSEACRDLRPSTLEWGRGGPVGIGVNRRCIGFGAHPLPADAGGPHADTVDVLTVRRDDGSLGVLFSHATHPVTLGGDSYLFSADYPGYAVEAVQRVYGESCFAMFLNGCCGNINSARVGTNFEEARRLGFMLAGSVVRVAEVAMPVSGCGVAGACRTLGLPVQEPPSLAQAEATAAEYAAALDAAMREGTEHAIMQARHMAHWAESVVELVRQGPPWRPRPFEVAALRVGDVGMAGLSGEVFVEYQLSISATSPLPHTMVFGTTNGVLGYLPTAAAYAEGGYEVEMAHRYYNEPLMIGPESEAMVLEAARELLRALM